MESENKIPKTENEVVLDSQKLIEQVKEAIGENSSSEEEEERLLHKLNNLLQELFSKKVPANSVREAEIFAKIKELASGQLPEADHAQVPAATKEKKSSDSQLDFLKITDVADLTYEHVMQHQQTLSVYLEKIKSQLTSEPSSVEWQAYQKLVEEVASLLEIFDDNPAEYRNRLRQILLAIKSWLDQKKI